MLVFGEAGERARRGRTGLVVASPHSAGLSRLPQCKDPVACVIIYEALSPEEHTKERTLFYEGAIHRVFPRDSWVKFL